MHTLITIPFSHFCEKARWALDRAGVEYREDGHLPILHMRATRKVGSRMVPILVTSERTITDSTDIVAWADGICNGAWLPRDPTARAAALALEETFDVELGPATRRWGYAAVLQRPPILRALVSRGAPRWQTWAFLVARPFAIGLIRRGLKVQPAGVERSRQKIEKVFGQVDALLSDGRRFLVGDAMSVADLAFAALAAPALMPPQQPFGFSEQIPLLPADARREQDVWRARPCGQFALRMYAEHRAERYRG